MSSLSPFGLRASRPASEAEEASPAQGVAAPSASGDAGPERRRHARTPLALNGRYMLEDGHEYPCTTRDVSRLGVAIRGVPIGAMGERVIAYLEQLGRIEGRIVRRSEDWFAIELAASPQKLDRLEEKISVILLRAALADQV